MRKFYVKVDVSKRMIYICSRKEGEAPMHSVHKLTNKGTLSKAWRPRYAYEETFREAIRRMGVRASGFKSVPGINPGKPPYSQMGLSELCKLLFNEAQRIAA